MQSAEHLLSRSTLDTKTGCMNWTGGMDPNGYGHVNMNGKHHSASRAVWLALYRKIADGLQVCHKCDNPKCINPDHLFLGTRSDNMKDCSMKGRIKKLLSFHGTKSGYTKYKCRCDECRKWNRERTAKERLARKQRSV